MQTPARVDARQLPRALPPPADAIGVRGSERQREHVRADVLMRSSKRDHLCERHRVEPHKPPVAGLGGRVLQRRGAPIAGADHLDAAVNRQTAGGDLQVVPSQRGELPTASPCNRGESQRQRGGRVDLARRRDDRTDLVCSHRGTGRFLRATQASSAPDVHRNPTPAHGLRQGSAEDGMAAADRGFSDVRSAHAGVPPLDIAYTESGNCNPADSVLGHPVGAARVVAPRCLGPDVLVDLAPRGQDVGDRATRGVGGWTRFELRRDPLSIPLATAHGAAHLGRSAVRVPSGEDPDFPDPWFALAHCRHRRRP